ELSKKGYYIIMALVGAIILSNSIEAFLKVKDNGIFQMWLSSPTLNPAVLEGGEASAYSIYLTSCLSTFFMRVITPIAFAANCYFALVKLRVNKLFVQIWFVLLIGLFIFTSIGEKFYSIFFIISTIGYIGLIVSVIYLWKEINKSKVKGEVKRAL
ncbi:MAG: hypothetical protein ACRDD2_08355, partial [Sarcina sp.]